PRDVPIPLAPQARGAKNAWARSCLPRNRILWLVVFAVAIAATGASWLYDRAIGFPREIAEHWVRPGVTWYWTGTPPLGYPFPAIVVYGYVDENGRVIRHGPFIERGVRGNTVVMAKTGS